MKIREAGKERFHQIEGDVVTIGRGPTNTIPIEDAKASKDHCRLERSGDRWRMVDLESKNGTRVNGTVRNKAWLGHGDTIQIGAAELRFGLEGGPARAAAPAQAGAAAPDAGFEDDEPPPQRPKAADRHLNTLIIAGVSLLGLTVLYVVANSVETGDRTNPQLIDNARELVRQARYEEALRYLQDNADPDGANYEAVQKYIVELEATIPSYRRQRQEVLARTVHSDLSRKVRSYHRGAPTATPEEILALVEKLKTEYAGTDQTALARKEFEVWFRGIVPERAITLMGTDAELQREWEATLERATEYQKDWRFREARETVDRFFSTRVLDEEQLDVFRAERDQRMRAIDQSAESIYYARERVARDLIKNKRYDQAITVWQEVVEKFGIEQYVRKAQAEIEKIKAMKG
jgi:hypothetical protein